MKKLFALLMTFILAASLAACTSESSSGGDGTATKTASVTQAPAEETKEPEETAQPAAPESTEEPAAETETPTPTPTPKIEYMENGALVTKTMYCVAEGGASGYRETADDAEPFIWVGPGTQVNVIEQGDVWTSILLDDDVWYVRSETLADSLEPAEPEIDLEPEAIAFDESWEFAEFSVIHTGTATLYKASENRKNIVVGVNAGHGTAGGESVYTYCHPDMSAKVTGGSTSAGAVQATAVSTGMTFFDGTPERDVTLTQAQMLRNVLLDDGYDVLMIRDGEDVQLDNVARTVMCNNCAAIHISIHWDGDGLDYDKGAYYMSVADGIKGMYPVSEIWPSSDNLGDCLIQGLAEAGVTIFEGGSMQADLTQTSYSKIPSVDIELGNAASTHTDEELVRNAYALLNGINLFFAQ